MDAKFSPRVKEVISYSREEALRLGHDYIGVEHLLLGIIREGEGVAMKMIESSSGFFYNLLEGFPSSLIVPRFGWCISRYIECRHCTKRYKYLLGRIYYTRSYK